MINFKKIIKSYNFWIIFLLSWALFILILNIYLIDQSFWPKLFGEEEISILDFPWSFRHLLLGFSLVFVLILLKLKFFIKRNKLIILILVITLGWEFIELIMEYYNLSHIVGKEHWSNRIIGDPSMNLLGGMFGYSIKNIFK
jgi:hypothetical protein